MTRTPANASGPGPAKGGRGEQTRQHILAAAEQWFAHQGFAETRMEDMAQQVGVRRPSLIHYFKDKPCTTR